MGIISKKTLISADPQKVVRVAIFASGAGSNAKKIIEYFSTATDRLVNVEVMLVVCSKPGAGVLIVAAENNIPTLMIEKERFFRGDGYLPDLANKQVDLSYWLAFYGRSHSR